MDANASHQPQIRSTALLSFRIELSSFRQMDSAQERMMTIFTWARREPHGLTIFVISNIIQIDVVHSGYRWHEFSLS
jgi:hypothetical protein